MKTVFKAAISWIRHPFYRYKINPPNYWKSIWLEWGWFGLGHEVIFSHGEHHGLYLVFCSVWFSHNLGTPNTNGL